MDPKTKEWRLFKFDGTRRRLGLRGTAATEAANAILRQEMAREQLGSAAPSSSDTTPVMEIVNRYVAARMDHVAKRVLLRDAMKALSPFWTGKTVSEINRISCENYTKWRMSGGVRKFQLHVEGKSASKEKISRSTARRDLVTLKAALRLAQADGILLGGVPHVTLPDETPARDRALSRSEAAMILHELWRGAPTKAKDGS